MLKTLKTISPDIAVEVLSAILADQLPNPNDNNSLKDRNDYIFLQNQIYEELMSRYEQLSENEKKYQIIKEISNLLTEYTINKKSVDKYKEKIGDLGLLNNVMYQPIFKKNFRNDIIQFGIKQSHVESAILKPDYIESFHFGNVTNFSMYIKNIEAKSSNSQLFVIVQRQNNTLIIHNAWRYFTNEFINNGRVLLESFINKYGLEIELRNKKQLLFYNYDIPIENDKNELKYNVINNNKHQFTTTIAFNTDIEKKEFHIAYLFAINNDEYISDIKNYIHIDNQRKV